MTTYHVHFADGPLWGQMRTYKVDTQPTHIRQPVNDDDYGYMTYIYEVEWPRGAAVGVARLANDPKAEDLADRRHLNVFVIEFRKLMKKHGISLDAGDYAASPASFRRGRWTEEWRS